MLGYLQLLRPMNCLMSLIAVLIGGLLVIGWELGLFLFPHIWLAIIAVFLVTGAGNAINDYLDIDSDRINRPQRPIPSGRVPRNKALAFSIILFLMGIMIAGLINWVTFVIALVNSALLVIYSLRLQNKILMGNISVGYLVGSTFLFGGAAMGSITLPILLALLAGLTTITREIVKDLEDLEGDRRSFLKKLTAFKTHLAERFRFSKGGVGLRFRRGRAVFVAGLSLAGAIIISPLPYLFDILGSTYLLFLIPTDIVFLTSLLILSRGNGRKNYGRVSKTLKLGMLLGLLAFILGALF